MSPPDEPVIKRDSDPPPIEKIRTEEPQAPFGQDEPNPNVVSDATAEDKAPGEAVDPGVGGYGGRDPKDEMPRVPSAPETQEDPHTHGGAPKTDHEPPASHSH
jgi:hypothetical protein